MPATAMPVSTAAASGAPEALAQRPARRLGPPTWRDPRLLIGVVLVLGSVVGGGLLVRAADHTVPVYAARHTLVPGQTLTPQDLSVQHVSLGAGTHRYLAARGTLQPGSVMVRTVPEGELVASSAVAERAQVDLRPVAVPVDPSALRRLGTGVLVDVWVADQRAGTSDGFAAPRKVAASVEVAATTSERGALGSSTSSTVHLLLGPDLVPQLIEAVDNEARITLVPLPATLPEDGS